MQKRLPTLQSSQTSPVNFSVSPKLSPKLSPQLSPKKNFPPISTIAEVDDGSPHNQTYKLQTPSKLSPTQRHKTETGTSPSLRFLRPLGLEEDEALGTAIGKLNEILKKQTSKFEPKKPKEEEEEKKDQNLVDTVQESRPSTKNADMVQRITRYKSLKGITPRAKEARFEERIHIFRNLKTFVDIKKVMKGIWSPESKSPSPSPNHELDLKEGIGFSPKKHEEFQESFLQIDLRNSDLTTPAREDSPSRSSRVSPISNKINLFGKNEQLNLDLMNYRIPGEDKEGNDKANQEKTKAEKTSERVNHAYGELKKQVVKHMGPDIIDEMKKKKNARPGLVKKLSKKNQKELEKMRQIQKELQNFKVFNGLMGYLSDEKAGANKNEVADPQEKDTEDFYHQIERTIFKTEGNNESNDEDRIFINEEENEEPPANVFDSGFVAMELDTISSFLLADEQVKLISALQAYKKRSEKIISLLEKKTKKMFAERAAENRFKANTENVKEQLHNVIMEAESLNNLNKATSPDEKKDLNKETVETRETKETKETKESKKSLKRVETNSSIGSITKTRDGFYSPRAPIKTEISSARVLHTEQPKSKFEMNIMQNKKKFIELTEKNNKKSLHYLGIKKMSTTARPELEQGSYQKNVGFSSYRIKNSFNTSINKLCGQVDNLLSGENTLDKFKHQKAQLDKQLDKLRYPERENIPEALKMPQKGPQLSKRAHFLMDLTRDLLRNQD